MDIFSKFKTLLGSPDYSKNFSKQNDKSAGTTNDYSLLLGRMQAICNTLPDGEVLLDVGSGEICMRVKWNDDNKKSKTSGTDDENNAYSLTAPVTEKEKSKSNKENNKRTNIQKLTHYLKSHY